MKRGLIWGIVIAVILLGVIAFFVLNKSSSNNNNNNTPVPLPEIKNNSSLDNIPASNGIEINNFAFSPSTLTIKVGDSVTWINKDSATHTVTSDSGSELSSSNIASEKSYSHTFNVAGTYNYHCSIHTVMKGIIIVK